MKKIAYSIMLLFSMHYYAHAQVGIGTTSPDSSSILDVESSDKGILIPRLDTAEINAIVNPTNGLLIYNTDLNEFQFNFGTSASPNWSKTTQSVSLKYSNTDTTTNINTAAYTNIPIFGSLDWNDNIVLCSVVGNTVTMNAAGRYRITVNISYTVPQIVGNTDVRVAVEAQLAINGTPTGTMASTGYVRSHAFGNLDASLHITEVLNIAAGDVISVQSIQGGNTAPAVLRSAGTSNIFIEKIK